MIREIKAQDKDVFVQMAKDFYKSEAVISEIPTQNILNTFDEVTSNSPYAKAYIIEHGGEIAGYALIGITYSNEAGGLVVWVEEIFIKENFRGLGLGSEFLSYVEDEFSDKAKRFRLEISHGNDAAQRLYERKGYHQLDYMQMVHDR